MISVGFSCLNAQGAFAAKSYFSNPDWQLVPNTNPTPAYIEKNSLKRSGDIVMLDVAGHNYTRMRANCNTMQQFNLRFDYLVNPKVVSYREDIPSNHKWFSANEYTQKIISHACKLSQSKLNSYQSLAQLENGDYYFRDQIDLHGSWNIYFYKHNEVVIGADFRNGTDRDYCFVGIIQDNQIVDISSAVSSTDSRNGVKSPQKFWPSKEKINLNHFLKLSSKKVSESSRKGLNDCIMEVGYAAKNGQLIR